MGIGLPTAVASRFDPHQARIHAVLHIAFQDSVFDQDRILGRRSLIIDGQRPTPILQRSVIDDRDTWGGDAFAQ